jgi:hypothetical protein
LLAQRVHVIAPYVGGAFGSKLHIRSETILAAPAARTLGEPVNVALTRQEVFHLVGVRPTSNQRIRRIRVELGDSEYLASYGSGGSARAAGTGVAVHRACQAVREKVRAANNRIPPEGLEGEARLSACGRSRTRRRTRSAAERVCSASDPEREGSALAAPWRHHLGMSTPLDEEAVKHSHFGCFINRDLSQSFVPVHADIPELDVVFLQDFDSKANALGAKGLGEVGICSSGAAVANAVFNATGVRVRDFPITLEKVLPGLSRAETSRSIVTDANAPTRCASSPMRVLSGARLLRCASCPVRLLCGSAQPRLPSPDEPVRLIAGRVVTVCLRRGRSVVLGRDPGKREARLDVELGEDASKVARDGVRGHEQLLGDLAVGEALGNQTGDGEL